MGIIIGAVEKYIFDLRKMLYSLCNELGTKKKSESQQSNTRPSVHRSDALTTELLGDSCRTARIF